MNELKHFEDALRDTLAPFVGKTFTPPLREELQSKLQMLMNIASERGVFSKDEADLAMGFFEDMGLWFASVDSEASLVGEPVEEEIHRDNHQET